MSLHSFTDWAESPAALEAAQRWATDDDALLDAYFASGRAERDYYAWCDDLISANQERLDGERRGE